jgi:predicted lipid-binding transport protein (Tim44 family)
MLRTRFRLLLVLGAFAAVLTMIAVDVADARGRISFGSRGARTYSAPPATTTAPTARPIERSVTQPTNPAPAPGAAVRPVPQAAPAASGTNRPGFTGGLLGAGLFGLVLGAGLTGGLGGLASFLGLALQIGIIATIGWLLVALLQARNPHVATVPLRDSPNPRPSSQPGGFGRRNAAPR